MTPAADLSPWLSRLIREGMISPAQAAAVRLRDNPAPFGVPATQLPATLDRDTLQAAAWELIDLAHVKPADREPAEIIAAWKLRNLVNLHEQVQTQHEERHRKFAGLLLGGKINLSGWQKAMAASILFLIAKQALLGSRGTLAQSRQWDLERLAERELQYLERWGLQLFGQAAQDGTLPTAEAVTARANLYTGNARGVFYQQIEESIREDPSILTRYAGRGATGDDDGITLKANALDGWVLEYIPKDDRNTCKPCHDAAGFYLLGEGPLPGQVCRGRARCRCVRIPRFRPDAFEFLTRG